MNQILVKQLWNDQRPQRWLFGRMANPLWLFYLLYLKTFFILRLAASVWIFFLMWLFWVTGHILQQERILPVQCLLLAQAYGLRCLHRPRNQEPLHIQNSQTLYKVQSITLPHLSQSSRIFFVVFRSNLQIFHLSWVGFVMCAQERLWDKAVEDELDGGDPCVPSQERRVLGPGARCTHRLLLCAAQPHSIR